MLPNVLGLVFYKLNLFVVELFEMFDGQAKVEHFDTVLQCQMFHLSLMLYWWTPPRWVLTNTILDETLDIRQK